MAGTAERNYDPRQESWAQPTVVPARRQPAGWYPDPSVGGVRWWDGARWTELTRSHPPAPVQPYPASIPQPSVRPAEPAQVVVHNSVVVSVGRQKSAGVAFLLTFLFGPLGMFYSTVLGGLFMGIVMIVGAAFVTTLTFGLGVPVFLGACWILCILWGCVAASR